MPPAQVQELVSATKLWYETHDMLQRDLAAKLGVSPTGLCQIFAGINQPSAATALAMIRFLEESKTMKTTYLDPRATPRQAASNPGQPKTLTEAKEMLAARDAELAALRHGAAPLPAKPASVGAAPTMKPKLAGSGADSPTLSANRHAGRRSTEPGADAREPAGNTEESPSGGSEHAVFNR